MKCLAKRGRGNGVTRLPSFYFVQHVACQDVIRVRITHAGISRGDKGAIAFCRGFCRYILYRII